VVAEYRHPWKGIVMLTVNVKMNYEYDVKMFEYCTDLNGAWHLYWWLQDGLNHEILGRVKSIDLTVSDTRGCKYDMRKGLFYTLLDSDKPYFTIVKEELAKMLPLTIVHNGGQ
jgi:hypothetical protein